MYLATYLSNGYNSVTKEMQVIQSPGEYISEIREISMIKLNSARVG